MLKCGLWIGIVVCTVIQAIADIEKAIVEALDKQYADVLSPLKENLAPKKFGLKYVQKLAKRSICPYVVPDEVKLPPSLSVIHTCTQ